MRVVSVLTAQQLVRYAVVDDLGQRVDIIGENVVAVVDRGKPPNLAEIKRPASERHIHVSQDLVNQLLAYVTEAHTDEVATDHLFHRSIERKFRAQ
jgi:hypothetical protein